MMVKAGNSRLANGRFAKGNSGNPEGRSRKPEIEELREALEQAQKKHNKSFLEYFVERAYFNDAVAIALAKKILPDKLEEEGKLVGGGNIYAIIQQIQKTLPVSREEMLGAIDKKE